MSSEDARGRSKGSEKGERWLPSCSLFVVLVLCGLCLGGVRVALLVSSRFSFSVCSWGVERGVCLCAVFATGAEIKLGVGGRAPQCRIWSSGEVDRRRGGEGRRREERVGVVVSESIDVRE